MNRALAQIKTDTGTVTFDVDDDDVSRVGPERISRKGETLVAELDETLEQALASARPAAQAVLDAFRTMGPDHVHVEFGLRLDVSAGAVIAKAGIGAHFNIKLDWDPQPPPKHS
jgi:hypothetical protein